MDILTKTYISTIPVHVYKTNDVICLYIQRTHDAAPPPWGSVPAPTAPLISHPAPLI